MGINSSSHSFTACHFCFGQNHNSKHEVRYSGLDSEASFFLIINDLFILMFKMFRVHKKQRKMMQVHHPEVEKVQYKKIRSIRNSTFILWQQNLMG